MATDVYKGLTIKIGGDTTGLDKALKSARDSARDTSRELRSLNKSLKFDPRNTELLSMKQDVLRKKIEAAKKELEAYKTAERQVGKENMSEEAWIKLQSDISYTTGLVEKYREEIHKIDVEKSSIYNVGKSFEEAGKKTEAAGEKISGISDKVGDLGAKATGAITAPIAAAATASVKTAVDIDTALTGVRKTVDGTAEQYEELKESAIDYSKTNAVTPEQILDLQALGAQLGFNIEELDNFSQVASGLDIATDMDAETAATQMAQFASVMHMSHDEIGNYGAAIVDLGNHMATTESAISNMAERIRDAGYQSGMSAPEVLGWSAAMTSLGINAEAGGTAFSQAVQGIGGSIIKADALAKQYNTTVDKLQNVKGYEKWDKATQNMVVKVRTLAKYSGLSARDFAKAWEQDASGTLTRILAGIGKSGDNVSLALSKIGINSSQAVRTFGALIGATKGVKGEEALLTKSLRIANDGWKENTALTNEVTNRNNSLAAKFEMLKNRVAAVADEVGEPLADALMNSLDAAEPLFKAVENGAEAFNEMSDSQQQAIIKNVALVASIGPMLSGIGRVGGAVGTTITSVGKAQQAFGGFMKKIADVAVTSAEAGGAIEGAATTAGAVSTGVGGFATLAVVLAAIAGYAAYTEWKNYTDDVKRSEDATKDFTDIIKEANEHADDLAGKLDASPEGAEKLRGKIQEVNDELDGTQDKISGIQDDFTADWGKAVVDNKQLQDAVDKIGEIHAKANPTKTDLENLKLAVDTYTKITGDTSLKIDESTGMLQGNTREVYANAKAFEYAAKKKALLDAGQSELKAWAEAEVEDEKAQQQIADAQQALDDFVAKNGSLQDIQKKYAKKNGHPYELTPEGYRLMNQYTQLSGNVTSAKRLREGYDDADIFGNVSHHAGTKETMDKAEANANAFTEAAAKMQQQADDATASYAAFNKAIDKWGKRVKNVATFVGTDLNQVSNKLEAAGVSTERFGRINEDAFGSLLTRDQGNIDKLVDDIQTLTNVFGHVGDKGTKAFNSLVKAGKNLGGAKDIDTYIDNLVAAGVSTDKLASLTDTDWDAMLRRTGGSIDGVKKYLDKYTGRLGKVGEQTKKFKFVSAREYDELARRYGSNTDKMLAEMEKIESGYNDVAVAAKEKLGLSGAQADDLAMRLHGAGIKSTDAKNVINSNWEQMQRTCGTDVGKMVGFIETYNKKKPAKKTAKINADKTDFDNKVKQVNNTRIPPKTVKINADITGAESQVETLQEKLSLPVTKKVNIQATPVSEGKKGSLGAQLGLFQGHRATGGIARFAMGAIIPRHADGGVGGILTDAALTRVGWVGEAGAEAIVPLTNMRYVAPFARAIGAFISQNGSAAGDTNYNVTLNGATLNDDAAIRDAALTLLEEVARKANMYGTR